MSVIHLASETDFEGWRSGARAMAAANVPPERVEWRLPGSAPGLFAEDRMPEPVREVRAPKAFVGMAEKVVCHRDPERFDRLYAILLRLQDDRGLLGRETDAAVRWLADREKAIRRDMHKMTAFVRFRLVGTLPSGREVFAAWFEPEHRIAELTAPFFVRRFTGMDWAIVTPEATVVWQGNALKVGPGGTRADVPAEDAVEDTWRTYFASIFNPARLKVKAMTAEMPKKYWKNLPEAELIPALIEGAAGRAGGMVAKGPSPANPRAAHWVTEQPEAGMDAPPEDPPATLDALRALAERCTMCPLHEPATQTVFGEGAQDARLMMVGEQPGDQEDLQGRPFVGPAGQVLARAMEQADIPRQTVWLTNAVKHFKFTPRGKRRLHQNPDAGEIRACNWWLEQERRLVRPRVVLAMGGSAVRGVLGKAGTISRLRGETLELPDGALGRVTVHPSYLLRLPDEGRKAEEYAKFVEDLKAARALAEAA